MLKSILPQTVRTVDPAVYVVRSAAQELDLLGLRNTSPPQPTRFCVSGDPHHFAQLSVQWLGCTPVVEQIWLPAVSLQPARIESLERE